MALGIFTVPDPTPKKHGGAEPWKPGQSGNPAGRPKGARNKLGEQFLAALQEDFEQHGIEAIQNTRTTKPEVYVRVIAGLLPTEHRLTITDQFSEMTDDELTERLQRLQQTIAPFLPGGTGDTDKGTGGKASKKLATQVH